MVYFSVAAYLACMAIVEPVLGPNSKRRVFWIFGIFPLMLFVGLRGAVDDDYLSYIKYFEIAPTLIDFPTGWADYKEATSGVEFGFGLVASLLTTLGISPQLCICLFGVANFYVIGKTITRYGFRYFYSLFLYYCLFLAAFFTHIRFALAAAVGFYAVMGVLTAGKKFSYYLLLLAAPFMHVVAWVYVLLLLCYKVTAKFNFRHFYALMIIASALCLAIDFSSLIFLGLSFIGGRYDFYLNSGSGSMLSAGIRLMFLVVFILGYPVVVKYRTSGDKIVGIPPQTFYLLSLAYCLATLIWAATWRLDVLYRLGLALQVSMILIIPYYLCFRRRQSLAYHAYSYVSFALFNAYFVYALVGGASVLGPYFFFMQNQ